MNIGKHIKELRIKNSLTQKDLAEKLNVTPQAVSRWELDLVEPSLNTIKDMCVLFNVTMDQLMGDEAVIINNDNSETNNNVDIDKAPIVGKCSVCNRLVRADEVVKRVVNGVVTYTCNECEEKRKANQAKTNEKEFKKIRRNSYILSTVISLIVLVIGLTSIFITPNTGEYSNGELAGVAIGLAVLTFTTTFCIKIKNNFLGDMWMEVVTWGCVKMPGVIFTLDIGGFIFLIVVKILGAILSLFLVCLSFTFATILAFLLSIFVFPFAVYWAHKRPEKTDLF